MKNGILIRICFVVSLLFISSHAYSQTSEGWEVVFQAEGCEGLTRSADAYVDGTRWLHSDRKPTTGYYHRSNSDTGNVEFGFDAPGSYDHGTSDDDLAYGYYQFVFDCSDEFTKTFYIDFRDFNWAGDYGDVHVKYFKSTSTLKIMGDFGWDTISQNEVYDVWDLFFEGSQNRTSLLVEVVGDYDFSGSSIYMGYDWYDTPKTCWFGWTSTRKIEARSSVSLYGYNYTFDEWDDEEASAVRYETFGDEDGCESKYEFTAIYDQEIPVPGNFSAGVQNDHPYLTWSTVEGDCMDGYEIDRNYDEQGFELAKTITDPSTSSWVDTEVEFDPGGCHVYYRMRTKDNQSSYSDWTSTESLKGYWWALPSDDVGQNIVFNFNLEPNVPNPFNPSTSIGYSLAVKSDVVLSIYNVLGKKIRTLVSGEKSMGEHSSIWDGTDDYGRPVSAGVYIYTIQANPISNEDGKPFRSSGKMLLSK